MNILARDTNIIESVEVLLIVETKYKEVPEIFSEDRCYNHKTLELVK